jgi:DNA replication protein DnaC
MEFCDCPKGVEVKTILAERWAAKLQAKINAGYAAAGIPQRFKGLTLETWLDVAGNDPAKRKAYQAAKTLLTEGSIEGKTSLYVYGPYGSGKTGLLTPLMTHYLAQGKGCLWIEYTELILAIQSDYSRRETDDSQGMGLGGALETAKTVPYLLLDEMGDSDKVDKAGAVMKESSDRREKLHLVIGHRHSRMLPTLITSNLPPAQLALMFGPRTVDRILEMCAVVSLAGENLRHKPRGNA